MSEKIADQNGKWIWKSKCSGCLRHAPGIGHIEIGIDRSWYFF